MFYASLCCHSLGLRGGQAVGTQDWKSGATDRDGGQPEDSGVCGGEAHCSENQHKAPGVAFSCVCLFGAQSRMDRLEGLESWLSRCLRALVTRESGFRSQHPHGGSHPSVTPSQGPSGLFWPPRAPGVHIAYRHRQTTHTHKVKLSLLGSCGTHFSPST